MAMRTALFPLLALAIATPALAKKEPKPTFEAALPAPVRQGGTFEGDVAVVALGK